MRIDNDRIERQRRAKSDIKLVDHPRRKRCGARQISHHSTHRDVHPTGATMDEIKNKIFDYAGKIKAVDPRAMSRLTKFLSLSDKTAQRSRIPSKDRRVYDHQSSYIAASRRRWSELSRKGRSDFYEPSR
jgi:ribosomal protein L32